MINLKSLPLAFAVAGLSSSAFALDHAPSTGGFDRVIANEQQLIKMLQTSGKISKDASIGDAEKALNSFLNERQKAAIELAAANTNTANNHGQNEEKVKKGKKHDKHGHDKHKHDHDKHKHDHHKHKHDHHKHGKPGNLKLENYDGETREAKVLAILMEFPDFPHNSINPEDTSMYYADYNKAHYEKILFGDDGWVAPNGYHANSFTQYYQKQSGGSYSTTGTVAGWYMASQNAVYYGGNDGGNARALVMEAVLAVAADPTVKLADFDLEDRYDLDGDGNYWEPDGLVDHIMVFHSSVGEEAGGGQLGEDAVWSHRWNLGGIFTTDTPSDAPYWGGVMAAYDYTIAPIDAAVGVISHEYGHDLSLPDEYDTQYTGRGEPVASWSVMSSGSWAGAIGGTEPTGFSAWSKEQLQASLGGNWQSGTTLEFDDIEHKETILLLDEAASKGTNNDVIRINLPPKATAGTAPLSGDYSYFGGSSDNLDNIMYTVVDLTAATTANVKFKTWYDIETDWDYGYVYVQNANTGEVTYLPGNITTTDDPFGTNLGNGITGNSNGWVDAEFDLSAFAGETIVLVTSYVSDGAVSNPGMYIDELSIEVDGSVIAEADADSVNDLFTLSGFTLNDGFVYTEHYYLLEWRTHNGTDSGLAHINVAGQTMVFEEGMIVWYVDNKYSDNHVGVHPGDGFLGVVDADQKTLFWSDGAAASTRYQIHDAAFNIDKDDKMFLDLEENWGVTLEDKDTKGQKEFKDSKSYISDDAPDAGRNITNYGLKFKVKHQSKDKKVSAIAISNHSH